MKSLLLFCLTLTLSTSIFATPEFSPKEVISFFNQPYYKVKSLIGKKNYFFTAQDEEFYSFMKIKGGIKYMLTLTIKNGIVRGVSTQEIHSDYSSLIANLNNQGFTFKKGTHIAFPSGETNNFGETPVRPIASSMLKFNNQTKYTCFVICPYTLQTSKLISLNYSIYYN